MQTPVYSFSGQGRSGADRMQEGGVYRGRVLEQNSKGGALLDLQGTKIKASFQGGMPAKNQVAFQVTGNKEGALQVRALQEERGGSTVSLKTSGLLKKVGVQDPSDGMTKAAKVMLQSGSPLTKDSAASVQRFMDEADGSLEQKLNTIKAAAGKQVDMTPANLQRIHDGLHSSRQTSDFMNEWTSSKTGSAADVPQLEKTVQRALQAASASQHKDIREAAAAIKQKLQQGGSLDQAVQAVKSNLLSHPDLSEETAGVLKKTIQEAEFLAGTGQKRLMQALQHVFSEKQGMDSESAQLLRHMQPLLSSTVPGQENQELQQMLQQSGVKGNDMSRIVKLTDQLMQLEESGRGRIMNAIDQGVAAGAGTSSNQTSASTGMPPASPGEAVAFSQGASAERPSSVPFETKPMLETTTTNRMVKATDEFQQMQKNTIKQLEQTGKMLEQNRQTAPQAKQVLEAAIHKLDRSILRSDFTLFTDMKTERNMLQASARLTEAKQLLSNGKFQSAWKVVDEVRQSVQSMEFNASEQKVKQMITREETAARNTGMQRAVQYTADQARAAMQEPSSRQVFELVRSLGLNREQELGQMLTTSGSQQHQNKAAQQNMKDALLQLMKHENDGSSLQQKAGQTLSNLTGQQLMSKTDQGNNMQQLLFNLPVPLKENMEDLQVYVQARQDEGEMDWENCNLYFLIETASLGETGIMLQASDRQLAITLKNDDPDFEKTMAPLVEQATESINEIGYNIQDIRYQPMSRPGEEQAETVNHNDITEERPEPAEHPFETMKGFDYKI
ncbi:hypothetical protein [Salibacterium lacus]|uniref:Flagellar hook-length control protein FliK n=1 Tax=Salibacterium lacus TaxID=1898109 RepID=A0ABW5SXR7_9BACI